MKIVEQEQLKCWEDCHGEPLQIGLLVRTTSECEWKDFDNHTFMVTSIHIDNEGVNIGINDDGKHDDFKTGYDGFRIHELTPATAEQVNQ